MILPLEQHVAPLALCQRLKALGAPQDSAFTWCDGTLMIRSPVGYVETAITDGAAGCGRVDGSPYVCLDDSEIEEVCAAYDVAELGVLLDDRGVNGWWVQRCRREESRGPFLASNYPLNESAMQMNRKETAAESLAALLIALAEAGVVSWTKEGE